MSHPTLPDETDFLDMTVELHDHAMPSMTMVHDVHTH